MSKHEGKKIAIQFTENLTGDVEGNETAFTVTGQELLHIGGELVDGDYQVDTVERYPIPKVWEDELNGDFDDIEVEDGTIILKNNNPTSELWDGQISNRYMMCPSSDTTSSSARSTDYIEIEPGETYTFSSTGNRAHIAWFNEAKTTRVRCDNMGDDGGPFTLVAPENAKWVRYYFAWQVSGALPSILTGDGSGDAYVEQGAYTTDNLNTNDNPRIRWNAEIPTYTDIKIEISSDKQNWEEVENGDVINADGIWIKATLSTEDETVTPILKGLWLEEPEQRQNTILLTMKPLKRFNNVEGKLTVAYDALIGTLAGKGGPVESFEEEFEPVDLVATPNPRVTESISVAPVAVTADLISIEHLDAFAEETITVAPVSVTAVLTPIDEINP